jgi:signal transduction histidine kinase
VVFVLIGLQTTFQALRHPSSITIDIGILFGGLTLAILATALNLLGLLPTSYLLQSFVGTALVAMPYMLFRLMNDVVGLPTLMQILVGLAFISWVVIIWLVPSTLPPMVIALLLLSLIGVLVYVAVVSIRATLRARGITRRRLTAVSLGSVLLACNFGAGRLPAVLPISQDDAQALVYALGLAAGIAYLIGFTPPRWLRRAWQEPELRAFLERIAELSRISDRAAIIAALEQGAAISLGVPFARIGLWDEQSQALHFIARGTPLDVPVDSQLPAAVVFRTQRPLFSPSTRYAPAIEQQFQFGQIARAVLAAPITAGDYRLGVFVAAAPRAPIFAADDLALIQLLADQASVILESRRLSDQAADLRAREQAAQLKEDFLSAAAHDLKTPLTTIISQAQLIDRRLERSPERPVDRASVQRIITESNRLRSMVHELLDAARGEHGQLVRQREPTDLNALLQDVASRHQTDHHPFVLKASAHVVGEYDSLRIGQLLDNLVENAVKYSPDGGAIEIALWQDSEVHITVSDHGIGIPPADVPHLFDRFHRGSNVDDRRFPGMGLGLYICHSIVTSHSGRISVESRPGSGTTFHVALPNTLTTEGEYAAQHPGD